ncbi:MAG: FAD-dependent thymidylate synthase, partial [Acidobacteriota bacterium]|nr:FAD-dependent thymidylate synthase [Acidobacteriota bacterium]
LSNGLSRYYRDPAILEARLGARFVGEMDRMFDTYAELLGQLTEWLTRRFPKTADDTDFVYRQAIRAKALDAVRGLLPASAISNLGIYASGQAYEALLLRMRAHPLAEVRDYAEMMMAELMKVIPSFLKRVEIAERGGAWSEYLAATRSATRDLVRTTWRETDAPEPHESVRLVAYDPEGEQRVAEAIVFAASAMSDAETVRRVATMNELERAHLIKTYVGRRLNRRHRPGRAFERTDYRFELVTDYGAFRDLQRHRLLTVEWQSLGVDLGYDVPGVVREAGLGDRYEESLRRSADLYRDLAREVPEASPYAVALAFRIRYSIQMNAREAMHLIELRSGPQGHPSYRRVAQEMARQIRDVAGHRSIADALSFVDMSDVDLERLEAERSAERNRSKRR